MKRFVLLSDLHAHPWTAFSSGGEGEKNSRLLRSLAVLEASLQMAQKLDCPWVFAGDIVHTAGYGLNVVLSGIVDTLADYDGVEKVAVWGNHDARGVGGRISLQQTVWGTLVRSCKFLHVLDPSECDDVEAGGITFAGAGYQPRSDLLAYGPEADVGIYHQTVRGSRTPAGFELKEGIPAEALAERYTLSVVGHVHHLQQLHKGKILVPGSPEHQNFGDAGVHGWHVITLGGKRSPWKAEFIPGGSPEFRTVQTPAEIQDDGHFYRVEGAHHREDLPENGTYIAPGPTTVHQRDLLKDASQSEQVLQLWLEENPPEAIDTEHDDDCPTGLGHPCACKALYAVVDTADYLAAGRELLEGQDPVRIRDVRVEALRIVNFCSYADQFFEFKRGVWLVTGSGRDYPSNGAGKTTLFEALFWLLFGKNTKGLGADDVIRWGANTVRVTGSFKEGEKRITVDRMRSPAGSTLTVSVDGEQWEAPSVTAMTDYLSRYFGLTPEIYKHLGYFSQEDVLLFSSATDGERKNVLADLIGLSAYQEACTAAAGRMSAAETERSLARGKLELEEQRVEEDETQLTGERSAAEQWDWVQQGLIRELEQQAEALRRTPIQDFPQRVERLREREAALSARKRVLLEHGLALRAQSIFNMRSVNADSRRTALQTTRREIVSSLEATWTSVQVARDMTASLNNVVAARNDAEREARSAEMLYHAAEQELTRARSVKTSAERDLNQAEKKRDTIQMSVNLGVCASCGQTITAGMRDRCVAEEEEKVKNLEGEVEAAKIRLGTVTSILDAAKKQMGEKQQALEVIEAHVERMRGAVRLLDQLDSMAQQEQDVEDLLKNLSATSDQEAQREIDKAYASYLEGKAKRLPKAEACVRRHLAEQREAQIKKQGEIDAARRQVNPHAGSVKVLEERITLARSNIRISEKRIRELSIQVGVFDYWKRGFSKQGIQSLLMEEIAGAFNRTRGKILPLLTQGIYDVQFSTVSRTRSGELRERTEFQVTQHGLPIPYEALSGGQRRRVDLGIMLVLVLAVSEWMRVPGILGLLVLDEVFERMDGSGAEGLMDALRQVQEVIPCIYNVTHDVNLQSMFPEVVHVQQDADGVSRIVS